MKDAQISGYFDTKYMTVLRIEQIFHNFEDQEVANFFNLEQVNFRVTLVMSPFTAYYHTAQQYWGALWIGLGQRLHQTC